MMITRMQMDTIYFLEKKFDTIRYKIFITNIFILIEYC